MADTQNDQNDFSEDGGNQKAESPSNSVTVTDIDLAVLQDALATGTRRECKMSSDKTKPQSDQHAVKIDKGDSQNKHEVSLNGKEELRNKQEVSLTDKEESRDKQEISLSDKIESRDKQEVSLSDKNESRDKQEVSLSDKDESRDKQEVSLCDKRESDGDTLEEQELPFGWEKVEDPHYGVYYIDHVNRRTQYENPVHAAKKQADEVTNTFPRPKKPESGTKRSASDNNMNGQLYPLGKPLFTTKPEELKGEITRTSLVKTMRGLGFTIVGGNQRDTQFLQIKNVVENGPAYQSGKMKTGDVIVRVNNTCVLGYTHQDVVRLFQSIAPGDTVQIEICRGYPLNFDPDDPNTEIVTTVAVTLPQDNGNNFNNTASISHPHHPAHHQNGLPSSSSTSSQHNDSQQSQHNNSSNIKSLPDLARSAAGGAIHSPSSLSPSTSQEENVIPPDLVSLNINSSRPPEILTIGIVKGPMGFGFTIADSHYGQRVKQILDEGRCKNLAQGDLLVQINGHVVRDMQHQQTVQVLKECTQGMEAQIIVQRGGIPPPGKGRKQLKPSRSFDERPLDSSVGSGTGPGAYFFQNNSQDKLEDSFVSSTIPEEDSIAFPPPPPPLFTVSTTQSGGPSGDDHGDERLPPPRPKTPSASEGGSNGLPLPPRSKTPTSQPSNSINQGYMDMNLGRREVQEELARFGNPNNSNNTNNNLNHSYSNPEGRPPAGPPRPDYFPRFNDTRQQQQQQYNRGGQNDFYPPRSHSTSNGDDRWAAATYGREAKPGQFRSRTPGPELMNRGGPDQPYGGGMSRSEYNRPKTPTAADMRGSGANGKSGGGSGSYGGGGDYRTSGRYTPNPSSEQGRQYRPPYQDYGRNWPNFSSPPSQRRYEPFDGISLNRSYAGGEFARQQQQLPSGPGRPGGNRQSTSFESENPSPSTLTRVPRRPPSQPAPSFLASNPPRAPSRGGMAPLDEGTQVVEMEVTLHRQESGYGFRIIGGTEEGSQVSVGHIVPGGAADADGRLRQYDEITHVDGSSVLHASHHRVVELMTNAALNGRVTLTIRRTMGSESNLSQSMTSLQPYDVVVSRRENEGFGFVIISSVNKSGASVDEYIGHIQENSPAERCGRLHVGDRILAVNGVDTSHMHHKDVVSLIKDSGFSVALTIAPPGDDSSSSNSQKSSSLNYPQDGPNNLNARDRFPSTSSGNFVRSRNPSNQDSDDSGEIYHVELFRGSRGFGFSIRGGREFNAMPLFVLRIADGGAADLDGHLRVGDQILEINEIPTERMTHTDAIDIIQNGGASVSLLMRRTNKPPPVFDGSGNSPGGMTGNLYPPNIPPTPNGPIGHSSPHMSRRQQGDPHLQHINNHDYIH